MSTFSGYFVFAKIYKTQGLKGRVLFYIEVENVEDYLSEEIMYLELDGSLVPFFVSEISPKKGKQYSVLFQDVTNIDEAQKIVGKQVYLPNTSLVEASNQNNYVGYTLLDQEAKKVGEVVDVIETAAHDILSVEINGTEVLIPIPEDLVLNESEIEKTLQVHIAPGLIDLYLG